MRNKRNISRIICLLLALFTLLLSGCAAKVDVAIKDDGVIEVTVGSAAEEPQTKPRSTPAKTEKPQQPQKTAEKPEKTNTDGAIPEYTDSPYYVLNNNQPQFTEDEITTEAYEFFSELDDLGRCGMTMACVGRELMPTEERESIGHVKPSGWVNVPYDFVDGRYLYNRSHLIGFQLTGENDNDRNLITGTRYFNVEGMLPFENMVADYVKETNNHVMYRVTPIYNGDELVARGVQMEAWSVEDEGMDLCYNVYIYNVQPGVEIDYATGESWESGKEKAEDEKKTDVKGKYVLNTSSKKFHLPECSGAENMNKKNREEFEGTRKALINEGYEPCGQCKP
ncbi:MAG: DNA/RNA non-specific endonuclease [Christensenellaceae bacterium]|nr:DNA/RNA non-specific endonuclease [Christensenellaceae bacterium]